MSKDLQLFDSLKADITVLVSPTLKLAIKDETSAQSGVEARKQLKALLKLVDDKRRSLVDPMNDEVKRINAYVKSILGPLENADGHVKRELDAYAMEQEKIRQEGIRKARQEAQRIEREAQEKLAVEQAFLLARQQEEASAHVDAEDLFGASEDDEETKRTAREFEEKKAREHAEFEARAERERMERLIALQQKEFDANQVQVKNTRKDFKCELLDVSLVPKEFLIITLNEKAVLAAARAGVKEIAGVRIWQQVSVAIGSTTRVPGVKALT